MNAPGFRSWTYEVISCFLSKFAFTFDLHRYTVVGVPKTIDNDMSGGGIAVSFGFDSASKAGQYKSN
jgi:hypothetical protein